MIGKLHNCIKSFITERTQSVVVKDYKSNAVDVTSEKPQGSVLGPLLFLVLMMDIDKNLKFSQLKSFADDTRVTKRIKEEEDAKALQLDLEQIYDWAERNNMEFNSLKFELLRYGDDDEIKTKTQYFNSIRTIIEEKHVVRDLGITMSHDATFTAHIGNIVTKAQSAISSICRCFKTRTPEVMIQLWKSIVMPHLDYCCQLWNPKKKGEINKLEILQKNFTRRTAGANQLDYWERLRKFRLYSLERRRERYIIVYVWKILENLVPNITTECIRSTLKPRTGRLCIVPTINRNAKTRVKTLKSSNFVINGPKLFNCLPSHLRNMTNCSLELFKTELDRFLELLPDEPLIPGYTSGRNHTTNSLIDVTQSQTPDSSPLYWRNKITWQRCKWRSLTRITSQRVLRKPFNNILCFCDNCNNYGKLTEL